MDIKELESLCVIITDEDIGGGHHRISIPISGKDAKKLRNHMDLRRFFTVLSETNFIERISISTEDTLTLTFVSHLKP